MTTLFPFIAAIAVYLTTPILVSACGCPLAPTAAIRESTSDPGIPSYTRVSASSGPGPAMAAAADGRMPMVGAGWGMGQGWSDRAGDADAGVQTR